MRASLPCGSRTDQSCHGWPKRRSRGSLRNVHLEGWPGSVCRKARVSTVPSCRYKLRCVRHQWSYCRRHARRQLFLPLRWRSGELGHNGACSPGARLARLAQQSTSAHSPRVRCLHGETWLVPSHMMGCMPINGHQPGASGAARLCGSASSRSGPNPAQGGSGSAMHQARPPLCRMAAAYFYAVWRCGAAPMSQHAAASPRSFLDQPSRMQRGPRPAPTRLPTLDERQGQLGRKLLVRRIGGLHIHSPAGQQLHEGNLQGASGAGVPV